MRCSTPAGGSLTSTRMIEPPPIHIAGGGDQQPDLEDLSGLVRVGCGCVGFTAIGNCRTVGTC